MTSHNGILTRLPCPERTFALVVGVEQYAISEKWNLRGPARDAMRFAQWLTGTEKVPPRNVRLLLSPLAADRLDWSATPELRALQNEYHSVTEAKVKHVLLDDLPNCDGDMLWIYWAGHGFLGPKQEMLLPCADAHEGQIRHLNLDSALNWWRTDMVRQERFPHQAVLVDACRVDVPQQPRWNFGSNHYGGGRTLASRRQFRLYAAREGELAKNDAERESGQFTTVLLEELEKRAAHECAEHLPDVGRAVHQRFEALRENNEGWQLPQFLKDRDWNECSFLDDVGPPPTAAPRLDQPAWDGLGELFDDRPFPRYTYDAYAWAFKVADCATPAVSGLPGQNLIDVAKDLDDRQGARKDFPLTVPFVQFLAVRAENTDRDWAQALGKWVEQTRQRLGGPKRSVPPSSDQNSTVLHLKLDPAADAEDLFLARMWLRRSSAVVIWESEDRPLDLAGVREALVRQLKEVSQSRNYTQAGSPCPEVERIEFHVPFDLLGTPFDQWIVPTKRGGRTRPLGLRYQIVVRCPVERLDDMAAWQRKWGWLEANGGRHPEAVRIVEDAHVTEALGVKLRAQDPPACVVAQTSAPRVKDVLDATLEGGVPVAIWRRGELVPTDETGPELTALLVPEGDRLDQLDVRALPERIRSLRVQAAETGQLDSTDVQLSLLWDDPGNTMDVRSTLHGSPATDRSRP